MKYTQTSAMYAHADTLLKIFHTKKLKPKCICIHMCMYRQNTHIHIQTSTAPTTLILRTQ